MYTAQCLLAQDESRTAGRGRAGGSPAAGASSRRAAAGGTRSTSPPAACPDPPAGFGVEDLGFQDLGGGTRSTSPPAACPNPPAEFRVQDSGFTVQAGGACYTSPPAHPGPPAGPALSKFNVTPTLATCRVTTRRFAQTGRQRGTACSSADCWASKCSVMLAAARAPRDLERVPPHCLQTACACQCDSHA